MDYKNINDYELLYLISENSEEAYNFVYQKYRPLISKLAFNLARKYNNVGIDYDDLFQEGMYGLSLAIDNFNKKENNLFYTFALICIKRSMERIIVSAIRYKNNILNFAIPYDNVDSDEDLSLEDTLYNKDDNVEFVFNSYEISNEINRIKYNLKDDYSFVYEMKINGFSNSDIAKILDIRYKDVDNYWRSIKNSLKKINNRNIE